MRKRLFLLAAVSLMYFSASMWAQGPTPDNVKGANNQTLIARDMNTGPVKSATDDPKYSIGVEDVLTIDVWKEPEVSRTVPVRMDGKISLPLVNDLQAAGLTPTQLSSEISERLRKVLLNPQVTVIVTQMNSQRIYIVGQITHGGSFPLEPNMTAVQALSNAGGFTPFANLKKIYVLRSENGQDEKLPVNFKEVLNGRKPIGDIRLKPGDTIVVP
jgi:polysaccharide biosynthesis/export protein